MLSNVSIQLYFGKRPNVSKVLWDFPVVGKFLMPPLGCKRPHPSDGLRKLMQSLLAL